jgi:O-methyltransferase involved in polyketide biosynthesis
VDAAPVTYVAADFLKEDWLEKLIAAGFRPDKQSFFLWESVTMYLDRKSVESMLRKIAGTAAGSTVAFDYFSSEIIESPSLFMRYARAVINATGEPWRFGLDNTPPARERVASFLKECGLSLDEQYNIGSETRGKRALGGFAIAVVPSAAILESGQSARTRRSQTRLSGQVPPPKNKRRVRNWIPTTYSFARDRRCSHLP